MTLRRVFIAVLFVFAGFAAPHAAKAEPGNEAIDFINSFGQRAIQSLTKPDMTDQELVARFRGLFEEGFDIPFIARSALGRFWRRTTDAQRAEYIPLFEDYIVQIYAVQFRQYSGETFEAQSAREIPDGGFVVLSDMVRPDGPTTKLEWAVFDVDGAQKIRDIKVEGVSMITTYRDQFANTILQSNGEVAGLIDALKQKTTQLAADGSN